MNPTGVAGGQTWWLLRSHQSAHGWARKSSMFRGDFYGRWRFCLLCPYAFLQFWPLL